MALDPIHAFYCRKDYLTLAEKMKIKSGGYCARCGKIFDMCDLRPHHIIELTLENIDDVNITLNEDNIEVICHDCHNAIHKRFGNYIGEKKVFIVHGSPFAGKVDYVKMVATRNDLIIDLDEIHRSLCVCGLYDKPDATKKLAFAIQDYLLNEVETATMRRRWENAYIIGTYPEHFKREEMQIKYNAELVHITTPKEECINRVQKTISSQGIRDAAIGWIEAYWQRFSS